MTARRACSIGVPRCSQLFNRDSWVSHSRETVTQGACLQKQHPPAKAEKESVTS